MPLNTKGSEGINRESMEQLRNKESNEELFINLIDLS